MSKKDSSKPVNLMVMVVAIIIGFLLLVTSGNIDTQLRKTDATCDTKTVQDCNRGILVIAMLLLFAGLAYIYVNTSFLGGCSCPGAEITSLMYAVTFTCLGIIILVLSGTMRGQLMSAKCEKTRAQLQMLNVIGGILTAIGTLYLGYEAYGYYLKKSFADAKAPLRRSVPNPFA